jgi:hypothetical protein
MQDPNSRQVGGNHYKSNSQHWDFADTRWPGYLEATATKYIIRARRKGNLQQDLEKAVHYLEKLVERIAGGYRQPLHDDCPWANAHLPCPIEKLAKDNDLTIEETSAIGMICSWETVERVEEVIGIIKGIMAEYASPITDHC